MGRKGLALKRFKVNAVTTKSGFFEYHYSSGVRIAGWDQENRFQEIFYKGSKQEGEYHKWQNPSGWIEESDLEEKKEGK